MSRLLTIKWHGIVVRTLRSGSGPEKNTNTMIQKYKYNMRTLRSGSGPEKNTNTMIQKYKYNVRTLRSESGPEKNTNTIIQKYKYNVRTLRSGSGPDKNTNAIIQKYKIQCEDAPKWKWSGELVRRADKGHFTRLRFRSTEWKIQTCKLQI